MLANVKALVIAAFASDSLALSAHWIYDQDRIAKEIGRVEKPIQPPSDGFHKGKKAGEFTHYGDQALVLLESTAAVKGFDPNDFSKRWQGLFSNYNGYYDKATQGTLENLENGKPILQAGSDSTDLAGASRMAGLFPVLAEDPSALLFAAKDQTRMTHNNPLVIESAEFFARVALEALGGKKPRNAMEEVAGGYFNNSPISAVVRKGLASMSADTLDVIKSFGMACPIDQGLPGTVHLIGKYQDDLKEALVQCVMAGGDSSARGMLTGMILGAYHGEKAIPENWTSTMVKYPDIVRLLDSI